MKKMLISLLISTTGLLFSCGGSSNEKESSTLDINTKDVKGTIEAENYNKKTPLYLNNDEGKFEGIVIKYENSEISIAPTKRNLEDIIKQRVKKNSFRATEIVSQDENSVLLKETKFEFKSGEIESEGYSFSVLIDGYDIRGKGKIPMEPIANKEDAERLMKIAKTFKKK